MFSYLTPSILQPFGTQRPNCPNLPQPNAPRMPWVNRICFRLIRAVGVLVVGAVLMLMNVGVSAADLVGNNSEGTVTTVWIQDYILANRFLATTTFSSTQMSIKLSSGASGKMKLAIYTDNSGVPGAFLRGTEDRSGLGFGWQSFNLTIPLTLNAGQYYWLAVWCNDGAYQIWCDASGTMSYGAMTYGTNWPDPPSLGSTITKTLCIYASVPSGPMAPKITSAPPSQAIVGQTNTYVLRADGWPTPTFSVSKQPSWLTLTGNTLSGVPTALGNTGPITVTATNSLGSDTQTFAISVIAVAPVQAVVNQVSQEQYTQFMTAPDFLYMHARDTRRHGSAKWAMARDNLKATFESFGLSTAIETYPSKSGVENVVAKKLGTERPGEIYLVGAHYDTVDCAGADDNGDAVVCVLEAARVLSRFQFKATIVFVAFDLEEDGMIGSHCYTTAAKARGDNIKAMLNPAAIAAQPKKENAAVIHSGKRPFADPLLNAVADACTRYGGLTAKVEKDDLGGGDYCTFESAGFRACRMIKDGRDENGKWKMGNWHTPKDNVDEPGYMDYAHATKMVKGAVGYLATAAEVFGAGGNQSPTCSITSPTNGATFTAPAAITIQANASDVDETVRKVELFQGATKLGEDTTSPYEYVWTGVAAGSYTLTAKATDNAGAVLTSAGIAVTVNAGGAGFVGRKR